MRTNMNMINGDVLNPQTRWGDVPYNNRVKKGKDKHEIQIHNYKFITK